MTRNQADTLRVLALVLLLPLLAIGLGFASYWFVQAFELGWEWAG